jgi:hypothetical protein
MSRTTEVSEDQKTICNLAGVMPDRLPAKRFIRQFPI